jgi:hypothetical protein
MNQTMAVWILSVGLVGIGQMAAPPAGARELDQQTFGMLSHGMTEAAVVGRTGPPDRRLDNIEPTLLGQRLVSYQYIWGGDTNKGEWTTIITFSAETNTVINLNRDRK